MNNGLHGALLEFQRRGRTTLDSVFRDRLHGTLDTNVTTRTFAACTGRQIGEPPPV
jgi:hypothetical protein